MAIAEADIIAVLSLIILVIIIILFAASDILRTYRDDALAEKNRAYETRRDAAIARLKEIIENEEEDGE